MQDYKLVQRFSLLSLAAFLLVGVAVSLLVANSLGENLIAQSKKVTAQFIAEEVNRTYRGMDFNTPLAGSRYEEFNVKSSHLMFDPSIKRVKVWNPDKVVVWSDDLRLVGKRFPDNMDLSKALNGSVSSHIKPPNKSENLLESKFSRLLELYVPIRSKEDGRIYAVFEIYQSLEFLDADISRQKRIVWSAVFAGFSGVYLACLGIVWGASRRLSEQTREIRKSEEKYQTLIRSAPDGIIGMDRGGNIIHFNEAAERMFGYAAVEVVGKPLTTLMPDRDRESRPAGDHGIFTKGAPWEKTKIAVHEGLHKDGRVFPLELSLSVFGEPGQATATGILRDISERKAMQEQLAVAEKQSLVSVIAGSIGHEINNSITGILGYSELLMGNPEDAGLARKCANTVYVQCQRLRLHAKNLLSLSKPQDPEVKELDMIALLDRVTEMLIVSGPLKKYLIRREYEEDLPSVLADGILMEQVVMNLQINASHAMGDQGILTLKARRIEDGSSVEFSITDTGHGIEEGKRHQIFLPFYTTKEKGKGTGLGLFISKQIVEQHKGVIESHSVVGKGTTFTVRIPAAR